MATLGDLGLSEYESRAYRALLSIGPATAKELSRASDVPMGRIYDVLAGLESAEMVRSQAASRPKKYVAVEPEMALDRLLADRRRELESQLEQYERAVEELEGRLETGETPDERFWTVAIGPGDTVDLLVERLGAATDSVVMVAAEPTAGFDLGEVGGRVVDRLVTAMDRGADVSVLLSAPLVSALPDDLERHYRRTVASAPDFEVRVAEDVSGTFTLIDDVEVCVEVPNPLDPDEALALIDVTDPEFARNAREEFEPRWERAEPYR